MAALRDAIVVEHGYSYSLEKINDLHCSCERPEDFIPGQRLSPCRYLAVSVGHADVANLAHVRFRQILGLFCRCSLPVSCVVLSSGRFSTLGFRQSDVSLSFRRMSFFRSERPEDGDESFVSPCSS